MLLTLLNPLALIGLLAVGVPIIIHLIKLRRKTASVPSLLLFTNFKKTSSRRKIEDILLLVLRCLVVFLVILLLIRPMIRTKAVLPGEFSASSGLLVIMFDNSIFSQTTFEGKSIFDTYREHLQAELATFPIDAKIMIAGTVPGSPVSHVMNPSTAIDLLKKMTFFPAHPDIHGTLSGIMDVIQATEGFDSFSILCAMLPDQILIDEARQILISFPPNSFNLIPSPFRNAPDPYIISCEWLENATGLRVRFNANSATSSNTHIMLTQENPTKQTRTDITDENITHGYVDIPPDKFDPENPMALCIHAGRIKPSILSEYFVNPYGSEKSKESTIILHDGSPVSRNAVLTLYAALDSHMRPEVVNFTNTPFPSFAGRRLLNLIIPPLMHSMNKNDVAKLEGYISAALSDSANIILFPQSASDFKLPGLDAELQPQFSKPVNFPVSKKIELFNTPRNQMEFFNLFSKGLDHVSLDSIIPYAPLAFDEVLFTLDKTPILAERSLPDGGKLTLWSIPFERPPLSLIMNPLFPQLMGKLCSPEKQIKASNYYCMETLALAKILGNDAIAGNLLLYKPNGKSEEFSFSNTNPAEYFLTEPGIYNVASIENKQKKVPFSVNCGRDALSLMNKDELSAVPEFSMYSGNLALRAAPFTSLGKNTSDESSSQNSFRDPTALIAFFLMLATAFEMLLSAFVSSRKKVII